MIQVLAWNPWMLALKYYCFMFNALRILVVAIVFVDDVVFSIEKKVFSCVRGRKFRAGLLTLLFCLI
jgi:hypothetical protein